MSKKGHRYDKEDDCFEDYCQEPKRLTNKQVRTLRQLEKEAEEFLERQAYSKNR